MRRNYSEKLKDPRWQKKRLEVMSRDNFKCVQCSDDKTTLNVHHLKYTGEPWEAPNNDLVTYCEDCHSIEVLITKFNDYKNGGFMKVDKVLKDYRHTSSIFYLISFVDYAGIAEIVLDGKTKWLLATRWIYPDFLEGFKKMITKCSKIEKIERGKNG